MGRARSVFHRRRLRIANPFGTPAHSCLRLTCLNADARRLRLVPLRLHRLSSCHLLIADLLLQLVRLLWADNEPGAVLRGDAPREQLTRCVCRTGTTRVLRCLGTERRQ